MSLINLDCFLFWVATEEASAVGGYVFSSKSPPGLHKELGQILFSHGALFFPSVVMLTDFISKVSLSN